MPIARDHELRPLAEVLGAGAATGAIAGAAAGAIDAVWSWGPAAQFVPGFFGRVRLVLFNATSHALVGIGAGVAVAAVLLLMARATRVGDVIRFAWRDHAARRMRDPADAVAGLALVLAILPCLAMALYVAYRVTVPYIANRKEPGLVVIVAMSAALGAIAIGSAIGVVVGRVVEEALRAAAKPRAAGRILSSPYAPLVAVAAFATIAGAVWAITAWDTVRLLPLRGPLIAVVALALAVPAYRPGCAIARILAAKTPVVRRAIYGAAPLVALVAVLALGSAPVVKAAIAYTGLGGPIVRTLRQAFDWDRDGYSRYLGGGDCDDGDRTIHPGAPEIPDDGIDQNCVGGDATTQRSLDDVAFAPVPPAVPKDFDVLLVTIDTTRADHLGTYGYVRPTTPNLDALGAGATVFEHGWAHAPSTRYSIPAILTGRYPLDVHYDTSVEGWPGLAQKATTIAEALAPLGFVSGAITNYWYFDKSRHMDQGIAEYDNENARLHAGVAGAGPERTHGSSSKEQTDKALAYLDRHARDRFFLWVHYYDPHADYESHDGVSFGTDEVALYDGEIKYTDVHIGRLLDGLRARGLTDKTVVVVTGDHGEGFGEHNVTRHGYHLYAAQTKVPMIIRVPGLPARRSTTPAGHADILPTLVNLAGGKPDKEMEGRSLVDALAGSDHDRVVYQQLSFENNNEKRGGASRACHVIYNVSPDTSWEVYRVDLDPNETEDLASDDGECADTRHAVEKLYDIEQVPAGAAEALLTTRPAIDKPLDIDLGADVRLLAVDAPARARPGDQVALVWTFEARGTVDTGWKLFVHVEGPNKQFLNADHQPARPFEWWKPGQYIRYPTTITIPRYPIAGSYKVWVGMFKGPERARVTAANREIDNNAVAVATIEVAP